MIWTIIAKVIGLVPSAIDAGKAIARALRPTRTINPNDSLLWHTVTYGKPGDVLNQAKHYRYCTVCQEYVDKQNELCSEAVRRAQLN